MPTPPRIIEADLTWLGGRFEPGVRVTVEKGRITAVERAGEAPRPGGKMERLAGRALLPGFVNTHSHAFQRGLRGRGEVFSGSAGSFWSWREEMYRLVAELTEERLHELSLAAFREMRAAGITAVGEFHYLHHRDPEALDFAFDEIVLAAAAEAGLRIVLLETYYKKGGVDRELTGAQRRFATPSPAAYWRQMDRLAGVLDRDLQSLGAVAHSLRAVSPEEVEELYREARFRGMPFHMHVEEQRREIDDVTAAYGKPPLALLTERLGSTSIFTAVHCTHTAPPDLARFVAAGGHVCICPLTEANLGDGLPALGRPDDPDAPGAASYRLCLGSDSNARISVLEEMRWLEYGQRLRNEARGVLRDDSGQVARVLLDAATTGGARALRLEAGAIEPDSWADFVAIDLASPTLAGWQQDTLLESLIFGAGDQAIAATCVGGRWQEHREAG